MWWSAIDEIFTIFGDFATEQHAAVLRNHQRSYYASIRFCMEAVSDLEHLCKNPRELSSFMTDGEEIKQKLNHLKKTYTSEKELDAERNKLLLKVKINSQITQRISDALLGCLRDYPMLCLSSHPSIEGFRLRCDEDDAFDRGCCDLDSRKHF